MNKLFLFLSILLCALDLNAQELWDDKDKRYTNHNFFFHWNFEKELEWEKVQPIEKHSVFRVESPYGLCAYVNINPHQFKGNSPDMWSNFDMYVQAHRYAWKKAEERTGGKVIPINIVKCRFAGENAIKIIVKTVVQDDVSSGTEYGITYNFNKDDAFWCVSIKCNEQIWKLAGEDGIKDLFRGFGINAKQPK